MRLVKFELEQKFRLRDVPHPRASGARTAPSTKAKKSRHTLENETILRQFDFCGIAQNSPRNSCEWFKTFCGKSKAAPAEGRKREWGRNQWIRRSESEGMGAQRVRRTSKEPATDENIDPNLKIHPVQSMSPHTVHKLSKLTLLKPTADLLISTSPRQHTPDFRRSTYYRKMKQVLGRSSSRML